MEKVEKMADLKNTEREKKIKEHFKKNKLPRPVSIKYIGKWHKGDCYAVTCGLFRTAFYAVYCIGDEIHSVRQRKI